MEKEKEPSPDNKINFLSPCNPSGVGLGGTIQDMKNQVAALQLELAAAIREANTTGLRSDASKVIRLVKYIPLNLAELRLHAYPHIPQGGDKEYAWPPYFIKKCGIVAKSA